MNHTKSVTAHKNSINSIISFGSYAWKRGTPRTLVLRAHAIC